MLGPKLSGWAYEFVDAHGFAFAGDRDQVEFAGLEFFPRQTKGLVGDDNSGSVDFVRALEAGGKVDGVSDVNLHQLLDFHRSHGKLATLTATVSTLEGSAPRSIA